MIYEKLNSSSFSFKVMLKSFWVGLVLLFKGINKLLAFLHIRLITVYCIIGGILEITAGLISSNQTVQIIFITGLGFLIFYWLIRMFMSCTEVVKTEEKEEVKEDKESEEVEVKAPFESEKYIVNDIVYPQVYRVTNHPKYIMIEYHDRYELYFCSNKGVRFIRRDEKEIF